MEPGKKILIVDDEKVSLMAMQLGLESHYLIDTAENGDDALSKFIDNDPDLIITDLAMPTVDGIGLIQMIRKTGSNIPIIAVSGHYASHSLVSGAQSYGANMILEKPFEAGFLLKAVQNILKNGNS